MDNNRMECKNCGNDLSPTEKVCKYCGSKNPYYDPSKLPPKKVTTLFDQRVIQNNTNDQNQQDQKKTSAGLIIAVIVIIILGVFGFSLF